MHKKTSRLTISIYYALVFMSNGAFTSYIGLYYADIRLGNAEIGLLTSIGAAVALIAQPAWGVISDRAALKNRILIFCIFFTGASVWLMPLSGGTFWLLFVSTGVFFFFQCAIGPLSDTITLELAARGNFKFSNIRTIGSVGFALMAAIAGQLFSSDISRIFPVFSVIMFLALVLSFFIAPVEGHQRNKQKVQPWVMFKNRELVYIYVFTFIVEASMGFFYSFHAIYSKSQGISTDLIGIGIMVGSFSQFPFMVFFDRIYKKLGIKNILLLSGIVHSLRWLLYATALTPASLIFLWALHGCTYIVFYLCLAEYVNTNVIKELKASGQMMNSLVVSGISKIFGGLLGGVLASAAGIKYVFAVNSVVCIAAVAAFYIIIRISHLKKSGLTS